MSIDNGLLGVSLFAFGYEDDGVWDRIAEINATLPRREPARRQPDDVRGADHGAAPTHHRRGDRRRRRPRPRATSTTPTTTSA